MRTSYDKPVPQGGPRSLPSSFLCLWVYWQPDPSALEPDMPGLKHQVWMEAPLKGHELCLCGSGQLFRECCRRQPSMPAICPNPALEGYSVFRHPTARFTLPGGSALHQRLHNDMRLHCVEDTPARTFWLAWGAPARESRYGIICFGDIELRDQRTLIVTALSPVRLHWLRSILSDALPPGVASPALTVGPIQWIDRRTGLPATQEGSPPPGAPEQPSEPPARRPEP